MIRKTWNRGDWRRDGEIWAEIADIPLARDSGFVPTEIVFFSEHGWRREPWHNPRSLSGQGRTGDTEQLPEWLPDRGHVTEPGRSRQLGGMLGDRIFEIWDTYYGESN